MTQTRLFSHLLSAWARWADTPLETASYALHPILFWKIFASPRRFVWGCPLTSYPYKFSSWQIPHLCVKCETHQNFRIQARCIRLGFCHRRLGCASLPFERDFDYSVASFFKIGCSSFQVWPSDWPYSQMSDQQLMHQSHPLAQDTCKLLDLHG